MIANYHTHTPRCNHAWGTENEYVECALEAGLQILGFSDHSPYVFPGSYYSHFRMRPELLEDYVSTVLSVREQYKGRIRTPLGLELEYYPTLLPQLLPILKDQPMDYLILGQHCLGDEVNDHYSGWATAEKGHLERYCSQAIDAMQTGLFTYFAHPDLLNYVGEDDAFYRQQMRRICREAKECGIPLEINLLGMLEGKHYPCDRFWEVAAEENCDVVLGRDAHKPRQLLEEQYERRGLKMVSRFGLNLLETVPLRKPW